MSKKGTAIYLRYKALKNSIFFLVFVSICYAGFAQEMPPNTYPQDYFRNPLDIPIFLAGNFGECRPGHFHSGIDIKTKGEENQPVHAAADGYIARIKMEKGGFGHALYISHPNGYTTLYAHLNDFSPEIQKYVKEQQYEQKRWDVDLQLPPSLFPVKQGEQIAWSGSTGSSTAPHLHFEIRNTKTEHPLNPELFGLPIIDNSAPVPTEVVLYSGNIYEEEHGKITLTLAKRGDNYLPVKTDMQYLHGDTAIIRPLVYGIGINVNDYMDGSDNTIAFYSAGVYVDDSLEGEVILDDIGYDETRYINAYIDYKTKELQDKWEQLLFKLPGNHLDHIYHHLNATNGKINLTDDNIKKITIVLTDDKGNKSTIQFYTKLNHAYKIDGPRQPTHPLDNAPKSVPVIANFNVNKENSFEKPNVKFSLDEKQLYDDIAFHYDDTPDPKGYSNKFILDYPYIPVHHFFELQLKPNKPIPFNLRSKVVVMYSDGKSDDGRAATFSENGWYKASVRNFGTYWLDIDTTAPTIKSLQKNNADLRKAKQITFEVTDNMTSVRTFSGYLDGKWICFEQHNNLFFYKFDEHCRAGKHELIFKAVDENGNERKYKMSFTR